MSPEDKQILIESMRNPRNPNPVVPDYAVKMLEDTCEATGLSWKQRHLYLIERGGKWQVTTSIDGFRLVANQDPEYAGQEGPFWTDSATGVWTDIPPVKAPYAAKVGVVRNKNGVLVTTWGVAKFDDYNARSPMWTKMGPTMVAKCAEALALRKALPGKLGGLYTIEEMEQADDKPKAKSGRNSKVTAPVNVDHESASDQTVEAEATDFAERIEKITPGEGALAELKALGLEIQKSNLGLKIKQELSLLYNDKKKVLGG